MPDGKVYAAADRCTHETAHLSDGLAMDHRFECPKHNGQFDHRISEAKRAPVRVNFRTYLTKIANGAGTDSVDPDLRQTGLHSF